MEPTDICTHSNNIDDLTLYSNTLETSLGESKYLHDKSQEKPHQIE